MQDGRIRSRRLLACVCVIVAMLLLAAPAAMAKGGKGGSSGLDWKPCGDAGAQCATADVPRDYDHPRGATIPLDVAKSPATGRKIGSLFFNFGGPGAPAAIYVEFLGPALFPVLNEHFDIIGMDPRGTGTPGGENSVWCNAFPPEQWSIYSEPFPTPFNTDAASLVRKDLRYQRKCLENSNRSVLGHTSTADVARDLDFMREKVGDSKMTYLGFSYGTFLGATYASLFPNKMRAVVLDGPVNANSYINHPMQDLKAQTAAFERALQRFFMACAADQTACEGFGGQDPHQAFDDLIEQADAHPLPAAGYPDDPRPVKGDDIRAAGVAEMYSKFAWPGLADALSKAQAGDGSGIRKLVDEDWYGQDFTTGDYDPINDRYFILGASEQKYRKGDVPFYMQAGEDCWEMFDHAYDNCGYVELNYGLWPVRDSDVFRGPFRVPKSAQTPLVVDTTYDPATPYRGGLLLARDLGNARVLTMKGDGHTAYGNGSPDCIDPAVENYLINRVLTPPGKKCQQEVPFEQPTAAAKQRSAAKQQTVQIRPHTRPLVRR
jgi:pimeloyl-ACP methyl ester carboxylesterase